MEKLYKEGNPILEFKPARYVSRDGKKQVIARNYLQELELKQKKFRRV